VHQTSLAPQPIMTSCVIPKTTTSAAPVMLLHGFDRSASALKVSDFVSVCIIVNGRIQSRSKH
jgi:hypothetical protein